MTIDSIMTGQFFIIFLLIINLLAIIGVLIALLGKREYVEKYLAYAYMSIMLIFRKKIKIFPQIQHYSSHQGEEFFYLLKIMKGSHQRFFKVISGSYVTIIPESDIRSIKIDKDESERNK